MASPFTVNRGLRDAGIAGVLLVAALPQLGCQREVASVQRVASAPAAGAEEQAPGGQAGMTKIRKPELLPKSSTVQLSVAAGQQEPRARLHVQEIPDFDRDAWRRNMLRFGEQHWQEFGRMFGQLSQRYPEGRGMDFKAAGGDQTSPLYKPYNTLLANSYYDFGQVLANIYEETGNPLWKERSLQASRYYADFYVNPNSGGIPGFWLFTDGLAWNALNNRDEVSRSAARSLARKAAFARQTVVSDVPESAVNSREIAYAIIAYVNADKLGDGRNPLLLERVDQAFGHIDQWIGTAPWKAHAGKSTRYVPPFMAGLTSYALARFYEQYSPAKGDAALARRVDQVPAKIAALADWLGKHTWIPALREGPPLSVENSFVYTWTPGYDWNEGTKGWAAAPDLNALAAVPFAFSYHLTGNGEHYQIAAKALQGATRAYMQGTKQFNQVYWLGPQAVKWLEKDPIRK